jgi:poly(hydroxyalkanoate) granule-associated protein
MDAPQPESGQHATTNGSKSLVAGVQSALRASISVFSMGKEEAESIINRMIERGELTEIDGKRILSSLFDRPTKSVKQINERVGNVLDEQIVNTLNMLNVPTRSDLQTLSEKINELATKVEELSKKVSS